MSYCSKCGQHLPDEALFCPVCGTKNEIKAETNNDWGQKAKDFGTGVTESVTGFINNNINSSAVSNDSQILSAISEKLYKSSLPILSDDEKIVKHYHCASVKWPSSDGFLTVTNKRVIFHATDPNEFSRVCFEVLLDSISGISCLIGQNVKVGKLLFGCMLALGSLFLFEDAFLLGLIILVLGISLAVSACKATYNLKIYSSKANGSPINIGEGATTLVGNSSLYSISCKPTSETKDMIKELGALIIDLQTLGDYAIEKWSK